MEADYSAIGKEAARLARLAIPASRYRRKSPKAPPGPLSKVTKQVPAGGLREAMGGPPADAETPGEKSKKVSSAQRAASPSQGKEAQLSRAQRVGKRPAKPTPAAPVGQAPKGPAPQRPQGPQGALIGPPGSSGSPGKRANSTPNNFGRGTLRPLARPPAQKQALTPQNVSKQGHTAPPTPGNRPTTRTLNHPSTQTAPSLLKAGTAPGRSMSQFPQNLTKASDYAALGAILATTGGNQGQEIKQAKKQAGAKKEGGAGASTRTSPPPVRTRFNSGTHDLTCQARIKRMPRTAHRLR